MTARPDAADRRVRIYEVGPRDGLQNEATAVPTAVKARFIELLVEAGLREIEATSFVSSAAIPQLADAEAVLGAIPRRAGIRYPVLVPNARGMARAEATGGVDAIAVFTAATDAFTTANIGMTVEASLAAFGPILARAGDLGWWRRAYVSTAFGCPYQGRVDPAAAAAIGRRLLDLGADEICFGDTIGVGVPDQVAELVALAEDAGISVAQQAFHFHDTRGTALANVAMGLAAGGRMEQKIYPDPYGIDAWDPESRRRVFVHIVNSMAFREITGKEPPTTPVSARTYAQYKLPWFDLYDDKMGDIDAPDALKNVKSMKEMDKEKGFKPQQDDSSVDVPDSNVIKYKVDKDDVGDGDW